MRLRQRHPLVELRRSAWDELIDRATRRSPNETGGILLGYRIRQGLHIAAGLEVIDPNATPTRYVMRAGPAQQMLDEVRAYFPDDSPVGFVGDWHVHLAAAGPSQTDRSTLGGVGSSYRRAIVSVIAVRGPGPDWRPHALVHRRRRVRIAEVEIIE